jgi:hypothetical protein
MKALSGFLDFQADACLTESVDLCDFTFFLQTYRLLLILAPATMQTDILRLSLAVAIKSENRLIVLP